MRKKIKLLKKIIFIITLLLCPSVFSQYYYFDSGGNAYQQGCNETIKVRINSEGQPIRAGIFNLLLDPTTTIYQKTGDSIYLRSFFVASSQTFINWTSEGSPSWIEGSNYTILNMDRNNGTTDYNGENGLYATINFKPIFSGNNYSIDFGMEYISGSNTNETTLSKVGGIESINPEHQNSYRTGTIRVLQEPCIADTNNPTITNLSITNNSSKKSYLSGLTFSLNDNGGVNGVSNVPYIFTDSGWTDNEGGLISNQYGIDLSRFTLVLSGNGQTKTITSTTPGVSVSWNGKTRQNTGLNTDFSLSSDTLFDFGIEKEISATFTFYDRAGNTGVTTISFNKPIRPTLISNSTFPANGDIYVNLSAPIKLGIQDDWAGINSGTIQITLSGVYGTNYGPYVFSGNSLNLSGVRGSANQPDYYINIFNHVDFPTSGKIQISVYAEDMEGNTDLIPDYTFSTRPNCSEFQCCDPVLLNLGGENSISYSNTGLIISGGNNENFSVDGDTGTIYCNTENIGLSVYSGDNTSNDLAFFTDADILNIFATGVKGKLSGDTLILSYIIDSVSLVIDNPQSGEKINTNIANIDWHIEGSDDDNRLSGYIVEIYDNSGNIVTGGFVNSTGIIQTLEDGVYEFFIYPVDVLGNTGETQSITFTVDRTIPICTLSIESDECTSGSISLLLDTPDDDIYGFNFDGSSNYEIRTGPVRISVYSVGYYTGYIKDYAGNSSGCSVYIGENILDNEELLFNTISATGYECQTITGIIDVIIGSSCGKDDLSKFRYSRDGGINYSTNQNYGIYSGNPGIETRNVYIHDGARNITGSTINYIWLDSGIKYNDVDVVQVGNNSSSVNWKNESNVSDGDCGNGTIEFNGFVQQGSYGTCSISGDEIAYIPNIGIQYEGTDTCIIQVKDDEGNIQNISFNFEGIDTKLPVCDVIIPNACTNGTIQISISGDIGDIQEYSRWDMNKKDFGLNTITGVSEIGIYTGYIRDTAGNTGMCTGAISLLELDTQEILYDVIVATGYECETITGKVFVHTGNSCGKISFDDFSYSRNDGPNTNERGVYSSNSHEETKHVIIQDGAGNTINVNVSYQWLDVGISLENGETQNIGIISGTYQTNIGNIANIFGAREGNCGISSLVVTGGNCSGGTINIDNGGNIEIKAMNGLDGQSGYCEINFSDNEGVQTETGIIEFISDTVSPAINIIGPNETCMSSNSFIVTGIFTENINGFSISDINIQGGNISNFAGNGSTYSWIVSVNPMVEFSIQVPDNVAYDNAGNPNSSSNILTGLYDNIGPNDVVLYEKTKVYSSTNTLRWNQVSDSGCAGVSGYNWEIYSRDCINGTLLDYGFNVYGNEYQQINGLQHSENYCRRVQAIDNFGNTGAWSQDSFEVDLSDIGCEFEEVPQCTNGNVTVTLKPQGEYEGNIYLSWIGTGVSDRILASNLSTGVNQNGYSLTGYIYQEATEKSNFCTYTVSHIDRTSPIINTIEINPVPECTYGTAIVLSISDDGCGNSEFTYGWNSRNSWNNIYFSNNNTLSQFMTGVGTKFRYLKVKDSVGNESAVTGVEFRWTNAPITANDFTGSENVGSGGKTANWKIMSNVTDGACGSGTIQFNGLISNGSKGNCIVNGNEITYTPNANKTGEDSCIIQVKDDENSTKNITINFGGIDTLSPTCEIAYEPISCVSGNVSLYLTSNEAIGYITGDGGVAWIADGFTATGMVSKNGIYNVQISDLIGNVGYCSGTISNINTGLLNKPTIIYPISGSSINDNPLQISWNPVESIGCRNASGYEIQICNDIYCNNIVTGGYTSLSGWTAGSFEDREYLIKVRTEDSLGGLSDWEEIIIKIDKQNPQVQLRGSNLSCMPTNIFEVTGEFTEIVNGFDIGDININGGIIQDFGGTGDTYTRKVEMNPLENVVVKVGTGVVYDEAGNENLESNELTGMYDNVGPNAVNFYSWHDEIYMDNTVLSRNAGTDFGCAGVSGYNWEIYSGDCINGTLLDYGFNAYGNESQQINGLQHSGNYCMRVQGVDNFGNEGSWSTGTFIVDLNSIGCIFEESSCNNTGVTLALKPGNTEWTGVYLSWTGAGYRQNYGELTRFETTAGKTITGYIYQTGGNPKQSACYYTIGNIDQISPEINGVGIAIGYECQTITGSISITDEGCGSGDIRYRWNGLDLTTNAEYTLYSSIGTTNTIHVTGYDSAGNTTSTGVIFQRLNSPITRDNFTGNDNVGNTGKIVNWRSGSHATDGACGSGTVNLIRFINNGSHGVCLTGDGDTIIYIPNEGETGSDICIIRIEDDEGSTGEIIVSWAGIDTEKPSCNLVVQGGQNCTSGAVTLSLSSESSDAYEYSFDGINWESWTTNITKGVSDVGIYTGYVKDFAGNLSDVCNVQVTGGMLDLDNPTLETTNWTGYECSTGSITVTGNDNSCGIVGLNYSRSWLGNTTNTNEIYSGKVGSQTVNVTVFDGVGYNITKQVTYTWQDVPVTGNNFTVENAGTGIIVDWFVNGNISGGICELDEIIATTDSTICTISGHDVIYTPTEGIQGGENCTITVTDGDMGEGSGIEITITFTGVDTKLPEILELIGGVGDQCTNKNTFIVTGIFSEKMVGVAEQSLIGENIEILEFRTISPSIYEWEVEMKGGIGKVLLQTGGIKDFVGNNLMTGKELILGNYDNIAPNSVSLISPTSGYNFSYRGLSFEWTNSTDVGCASLSGYTLKICKDSACNAIVEQYTTDTTGITITLQSNGNFYWTVLANDGNGNQSTGEIWSFTVQSIQPICLISQSACSNTGVHLILTGNKDISEISGNISWIRNGSDTYYFDISENIDVWAIVEDDGGQTGYCHLYVSNFDNVGPDFSLSNLTVNEGEWLYLGIINPNDTGCASQSYSYRFGSYFGNNSWQNSNIISIPAERIGKTGGIEIEQVVRVKDNIGNITTKTGIIKINDVPPTLSHTTGILKGIYTGEVQVDVFDLLGITEGACGTGDLQLEISECTYATGHVLGGNLIIHMAENSQGHGSCTIRVKDNENTYADVDGVISFSVDTKKPECTGLIYDPKGWTSGNQITVSLTGCTENIIGATSYIFTGNGEHLFEFTDELGNTGELLAIVTGFDRESPTFVLQNGSGYECETGNINIMNAVDTGIGLAEMPYSFDGINWNNNNKYEIYFDKTGVVEITGYTKDGLGNTKTLKVTYIFNDSQPTATGFSAYAMSGTTVNWKILSDAKDGLCGNDDLVAIVTGGNIGICEISGELLTYTPNVFGTTGLDNCQLDIYDDEGNKTTINVEFTDINNYPKVELISPTNGSAVDAGEMSFVCTGIGNTNLISKYVYRIWSSNDDYIIEQTGSNISLNLVAGTYYWNVYAEFIDGTTGGISDTYSFNILSSTTTPTGGGGGWHRLTKDKCPNGDDSDSYYDGTCEKNGGTHGSAGIDICGVNASRYSDEQKLAYLYSYTYGITTICPIQDANLDGYLIRSHFAKMISEFSVNVLGKKPEKGKTGCDKFNDIDKINSELHDLIITSCELGLMGLESDGQTPAKSFNPNDVVTRAQFGTVLSRLLFGDMYNIKDKENAYKNTGYWYKSHLAALKDYGIMTQIDGDWPNYKEQRGWVMLMLQRSDNYGIFAGKVPAKNGVTALFEK